MLKKILLTSLAVSLSTMMGCSDNSSTGAPSDSVTPNNGLGFSCTVTTSGNVVTINEKFDYEYFVTDFVYENGRVVINHTDTYISKSAARQEYDYRNSDSDYFDVSVDGKVLKYSENLRWGASGISELVSRAEEECEDDRAFYYDEDYDW